MEMVVGVVVNADRDLAEVHIVRCCVKGMAEMVEPDVVMVAAVVTAGLVAAGVVVTVAAAVEIAVLVEIVDKQLGREKL